MSERTVDELEDNVEQALSTLREETDLEAAVTAHRDFDRLMQELNRR